MGISQFLSTQEIINNMQKSVKKYVIMKLQLFQGNVVLQQLIIR